mmetsp:Transcript_73468/g.212788  ORF Transcript_73468/g.212788 Transcript_73468/m.212788 type:complete len:532 (-) Transcript_73468:61-1656(-)
MGQSLPKAVESIVVERHADRSFRVGLAEMNGWRSAMEDAHLAILRDTWGFFGVFDGHGGSQCSAFVAKRLTEELGTGPIPVDDAAVKDMMLKVDREFLDTKMDSGSTGTFVLVQRHQTETGRYLLRVGNIGDSRVLLGRADGTIVQGPGTDGALTTDHKPDNPSERERIERTGGTVETAMGGVARVNGDLAVSRAFGDARHKEQGGPAQEDHPVSAEPEFTTITADATDFLVLVCDGISEGEFPNAEVIQLAAEKLKEGGPNADLGAICAAICRRALARRSMDNLSCMIVQFGGGEEDVKAGGPHRELIPGAFAAPSNSGFRKAYTEMATRAGLSMGQALELRYDIARAEIKALEEGRAGEEGQSSLEDLRHEIAQYAGGPAESLLPRSQERIRWFEKWLESHEVESSPGISGMQILQAMACRPCRPVLVAPLEKLKPAVMGHAALKWDARYESLCGRRGVALVDDPEDGTSQVKVNVPQQTPIIAWLPKSTLIDVDDDVEEAEEESSSSATPSTTDASSAAAVADGSAAN